ncbi:lysozyme inhibitor LprI family protein [Reyranella sp.]|uniref:lysozyme inhibitor LprI family protein n=1 Tax=Reyranella sp. TaxID=1929291 RepID=UPI0040374379
MINPTRAMSLCAALAATLSSLVATVSLAADPPAKDCNQEPDYKEMVVCHTRDTETNIAKVAQAYELLMKRLGTSPAAETLGQSQKAWLEYRSSYCDFMALANEGGSIVRLTRVKCYGAIAKARLHELEYQVDCKQGDFGCFWQR